MRDLMEAVHVQLSHERTKVPVFEPLAENFVCKTFVVKYCVEFSTSFKEKVTYHLPKNESPASDQRIRSALLGSLTILPEYTLNRRPKHQQCYPTHIVFVGKPESLVLPLLRYVWRP